MQNTKENRNTKQLREEAVRFVNAIQTPKYLELVRDIAIMYVNKEQRRSGAE